MKIEEILGLNDAKLIYGNSNEILDHFSIDTRTLKKGDTYIGIQGEVFNGNELWEEAFLKGAKTVIISGIDVSHITEYPNCNFIMVSNTIQFLTMLAKRKRDQLRIPIIAVTGSVGKTSTRNIIADVLSSKYKVLKTKGNLNTNIGLSLTLLSLTDEEIVVLEMGMNQPGEISVLTNIAKPDVAVITNIGTAHIGNLGSRENILKAKLEILEALQGPIIINNDNDLLCNWKKKAHIPNKIITYGIDTFSDYQASDLRYDASGSHYQLNQEKVDINVIGKHFIYNSLVAFIIGDLYHVSRKDIISKLKHLTLEPNRMELINYSNITIINDTYNASYDSVYYALEVLNSFKGRKIAVLGDILELGEFGEEIHRKIGKLIVEHAIDLLITVGDLAQFIHDEALLLGYDQKQTFHFHSNEEAIQFINKNKRKKDTILIKASNGMHFIEIVKGISL